MRTANEYATGLRELADWIEAHPELDGPRSDITVYSLDTKEQAAAVLRALKPCTKRVSETLFYIERSFGPIKYQFAFNRESICKARIVGQKTIPEHTEPERLIPARVIVEHVEDIIEWDCTEGLLELPKEEAETA